MARKFAYLAVTIWEDPDFVALDEATQRMYLFLLSQRDLSQAGLIPLRVRRWARTFAGGDDSAVRERLTALTDARFVVIDDDAEELLIRTFVRNDGVYKQPKVMVRMREDALQIASPLLRATLLAELDRIPLDELPSEPGGRNRDTRPVREVVAEVIAGLRDDLTEASPGVSDTPGDGYPIPPRGRAGALPHPPTPIPLPPTPSQKTSPSPAAPATTSEPGDFDEFWSCYPRRVGKQEAAKAFAKATKATSAARIVLAARRFAQDPNLPDRQFVPHPATWLNRGGWDDEPLPARAPSGSVDRAAELARSELEKAQAADDARAGLLPLPQIGA